MKLKNVLKVLFTLVVFTLLVNSTAFAQTTYFVDGVAGNDAWTGTAATFQSGNVGPKKTIQAMHDVASVVNTDIISIAAGTYNETVTLTKRVQLSPSGAITVQNITLNTGSTTSTTFGNAAQNLTISGTLLVQSGTYALTTANVIIAAAGTLEVRVGGATGLQSAVTTTAGAYTLTFTNTAALSYLTSDIGNNNPGNVNFNGSAAVTLPAALTAQGNLTIASGASVNLNTFDIVVQGGGFTNNGSYSDAAGAKVQMTTAGGTITGTGSFQNLELNGGFTWALGSSLTFVNVSQATASLINMVGAAVLAQTTFSVTTPGSVTMAAAATITQTTGKFIFSGTTGTIGAVTFTTGAAVTIPNLNIDKPSGSTVTLAGGFALNVSTLFEFPSGIFNIGASAFNLTATHGATASIGGNLNGAGIFTIATTAQNVTVSGAGQINTPFVVNSTPRTVTFTQLTTIGNNLTLTSGNLTTSSLQLINGTVTLTAGTLTFNTTNLSVTSTVTLDGGTLAGSSPMTISGTLNLNGTAIINTTGSITAAVFDGTTGGAGTGAVTCAGLTTTGTGAITFGTGVYTINGNLAAGGTFASSDGIVNITGSASSGGTFTVGIGNATGAFTVGVNLNPTGAFTFAAAAATALTVTSGSFTGGGTVNFTNGTSVTVTAGNLSSTGAFTAGAANVSVGGNFTGSAAATLGAGTFAVTGNMSTSGTLTTAAGVVTVGGNLTVSGSTSDMATAAGTVTVTGTASIGRDLTLGAADVAFNGTGSHSVGRHITTSADDAALASASLTFGGALTIGTGGLVTPLHNKYFVFGGAVTASSTSDFVLTVAAKTITIDFNRAASFRDLLFDTDATLVTVNFNTHTSLPVSQIRNISVAAGANAASVNINVNSASSTSYHTLRISGDITTVATGLINAFTVGANATVVFNGSGELHTSYANAQSIDLTGGALTIAGVEINNTATDSDPTLDGGGNAGTADERLEAVYVISANALTISRLTLTNNGINGTNVTIASPGTITRSAGSINVANQGIGAIVDLVYTNQADIVAGREYTVPAAAAAIRNLSLTGTGAKVTLATSGTGTMTNGSLTVASGRELATAGFAVTVLTPAATGTYLTVSGTVSGTGTLTYRAGGVNIYTVSGTGSINNLTADFAANAGTITLNGPSTITASLTSAGGQGTLVYGTSAPATIGGNFTVNVTTLTVNKSPLAVTGNVVYTLGAGTFAGALSVGGNFTHTAGNISLAGNLAVTGNYAQTAGNLTISATAGTVSVGGTFAWNANTFTPSVSGDATVNGNFTSTGGTIAFPAASTSSLNLLGVTNSMGGPTTYTFGAGASGRVKFNATAAQTLNLTATEAIARFELNNSAGLTVSGAAVQLQIVNLLLTNGVLTHNGLLNMAGGTDRIVRDAGSLASFPATGPGQVEYISTAGFTTGFETPSILNQVIVNATSGNPTYTLDKNITILTGGVLNLSRGTLVVGGNSLIIQNASTIMRAEGALTGTPIYGTGQTLQYFNTDSDLTTGTEFTNDGSITTLVINSPSRNVTLGGNVTVAGASGLNFGTLNLNNFTFTQTGNTFTNNGAVTGVGTLALTGGATLAGITASWPAVSSTGGANVITPTAPARAVTFASLSISGTSTLTLTAANIAAAGVTITGTFTVSGTAAGAYVDNAVTTNFQGNVSLSGTSTITQTGLFNFNGTSAQTLTTNKALNNVTLNNAAGLTLSSNVTITNGSTLTMTVGNITTGSNFLQIGTTAATTLTRVAGMVVGNLYQWIDSDPGTGVTVSTVFPLGTGTNYRPVTLAFTGTAAGSQGQIIRTSHTNSAPTGTVGLPIAGPPVINKLSPMFWDVAIFNQANTAFQTPLTNPQVTLGVGGFTYGDITGIRSVYRLTNAANTWQIPGVYVGAYYDINGVANVIHSGVSGWNLEPSQLFTVGYQSTLAVANAIAAQTLTVGGAAYTKTIQAAPAVFSGAVGALTYTVSSSVPAVATVAVAAGVLTVTQVSAGTTVITLTATDVNGDFVTTTFNVTVNVAPTFTSPVVTSYPMNEGATQNVTFAASATGQTVALSMLAGNPAYATFTTGTGVLALAPGYDVVTTGSKTDSVTIRATASPSGLTTDQKIYVTVTNSNRAPVFTAQMTNKSIKNDSTLTFTYTATDADAQTLTYLLVPVTPAFAGTATVGSATGLLTFAPTFADAGKVFSVGVKVTDGVDTVASTVASVTVTYARSKGDVDGNDVVQAIDASKILQHVVGLVLITGADNLYAADVNSDGQVGALDAAWVLYYVVNGTFPTPKIGAVSGTVSWGDITSKSDIVTIPLKLSEGANVLSAFVSLSIDKNLASLESISSNLPEGWQIVHHVTDAGQVNIALAGLKPLEDGSFVDLSLKLLNKEAKMNVEGSVDLNDQLTSMLKSLSVRQVPTQFGLSQNYPNPFNPTTKIQYQLPQNANVTLAVYNMLGQKVKTLLSSEQEAGYYNVEWNGLSDNGTYVTSGLYVYRLEAGSYVATKKMNFVK